MVDLSGVSLKVKNYKSFGETPQGFDRILPINLIIGKNNAGKSALLDAISYAAVKQANIMPNLHNDGKTPQLLITQPIEEPEIRRTFPENTSGGHIGGNHYEYGKQWIGNPITTLSSFTSEDVSFVGIEPAFSSSTIQEQYGPGLVANLRKPFANAVVRRLAADRDIRPEGATDGGNLSPDGTGATNLIRFCLHDADANAGPLIKNRVLSALNFIFEGETVFTDILVKSRGGEWEVYLVEDAKGNEIPLSNSGSGLKTIILVLLQLQVIPALTTQGQEERYLFLLEEVENNLHPGLLRNLLSFIREYAHEKNSRFFITTHSSVTIDLFDKDADAQIIHVKHDNSSSTVSWTQSYHDKQGIIDDLDVRSSDILQSNAVIWVEGPSDRTYINHWITLHSNGELREGEHYQCVFYGGRLLARISADPENTDDANILKINRHAILVMDSDIAIPGGTINATKARMQQEVETVGGVVWVTHGKEIENYLPKSLLEDYFGGTTTRRFAANTKIQGFLNALKPKSGDAFVQKKVFYAEEFIEKYDKSMLEADFDLSAKIDEICVALRRWNGVKTPSV